jgi:transposase
MSLIHTCQLCDVNSLDYLIELQRHAQDLTTRPAEWMPSGLLRDADRCGGIIN